MYKFGKFVIEKLLIDADKARIYDDEWVIWGEATFKPVETEEADDRRRSLDGDDSGLHSDDHSNHAHLDFLYVVSDIKLDVDKYSTDDKG